MTSFDIDKIRSGDLHAFRPFFDHYFVVLQHFAMKYLDDDETACDIAQETLVKFWERRRRFDNIYSASSFLFKTTRNAAINELKHRNIAADAEQKILKEIGDRDHIRLGDEKTVQAIYNHLEEEISRLPERTQEVIRLQIAGLHTTEIAEKLQVGKESVKTLKKYGLNKLKDSMGDLAWAWFSAKEDYFA